MQEVIGIYNCARVFTHEIEPGALEQIQALCNQPFSAGSRIRIMPDVHAGQGCVIGFTANLGEKVIPSIVGVDIGCGMLTVELGPRDIDFQALDHIIRAEVPSGKNVHPGRLEAYPELETLHCYRALKHTRRMVRSIGTLGGGNHFIEIDVDEVGHKYLIIHTGSRNLGKQVADYYQNLAYELLRGKDALLEKQQQLIDSYKAAGRRKEIQKELKRMHQEFQAKEIEIPKNLCYLTGIYRQQYLDDMAICQNFATRNRAAIARVILEKLFNRPLSTFSSFETVHNYIDHESHIVRKGAVSAKKGEKLLIPLNMRDGCLICVGKGNPEWNESAPHGAGRLYSRGEAKARFTLEDFQETMTGVYTTSVGTETLDECPMAYKPMTEILEHIAPTVDVLKHLKPLYNFKAGE